MSLCCRIGGTAALAGLAALALAAPGRAQVTVSSNVMLNNTLFDYRYSVANASPDVPFFTVTLTGMPGSDAIEAGSLFAPAGFQANFDPGLGLITFLADASSFDPGTTVGDFGFTSKFGPTTTPFEAAGLDATGALVLSNGTALGPVGAAVPEPGTLALGIGLATGALVTLRRRGR